MRHGDAHRGLRAHRRLPHRRAGRRGTAASTGCACPASTRASTFGALLGDEEHGRWLLAPEHGAVQYQRRYVENTFVLVTTLGDRDRRGRGHRPDAVRRPPRRRGAAGRGISGTVRHACRSCASGSATRRRRAVGPPDAQDDDDGAMIAVAGPDAVVVRGPQLHRGRPPPRVDFTVRAGDTVDITHDLVPVAPPGARRARRDSRHRSAPSTGGSTGPTATYDGAVLRRAGAPVAAGAARAHPRGHRRHRRRGDDEPAGAVRRRSQLGLPLRLAARRRRSPSTCCSTTASPTRPSDWRGWLLRAIAGDPADVQIMYGLAGERRPARTRTHHLPGYRGAAPVRVGNAAYQQYQGDVFGEVMVALQAARDAGLEETEFSWPLQRALIELRREQLAASPTTASGRSAGRSGTSPTPAR